MATLNPKLRAAVVEGIANGWSAKHTAIERGFNVESLRSAARSMKMSFPWQRIGNRPKWCAEPMPLKSLFKRNRTTFESAGTQLRKALKEMDKGSPAAAKVARVITFLQTRQAPPHWESQIKLTR